MATPVPRRYIHEKTTGLSGNEIYCLNLMGLRPGSLCVGNCVYALGVLGSITSGLRTIAGGEITEITQLINEGRKIAVERMHKEAEVNGGIGVTGVSTELIIHASNIEFLTMGSAVRGTSGGNAGLGFSTSADAQELYCQSDAGFVPHHYVFGNVAYSIGFLGGLAGTIRSIQRGEVPAFTEIFDQTRHLALTRITDEAKKYGANAVVGIETTITPLLGSQEMVMIGTASSHPLLAAHRDNPVTSDMTNQEMWNMINIGYMPMRLVMGVSVYSLGLSGSITSAFRSMVRGEVTQLSTLLYEAREKSLDRIQREAERWGADEVVGVKTHIYELGGGLLEFLAIGTAVKKIDKLTTKTSTLPPQAIVQDKDTYFQSTTSALQTLSRAGAGQNTRTAPRGSMLWTILLIIFVVVFKILSGKTH